MNYYNFDPNCEPNIIEKPQMTEDEYFDKLLEQEDAQQLYVDKLDLRLMQDPNQLSLFL